MHYEFCPACGTKLTGKHAGDDGLVPFCQPCNRLWFDTFHSCIIVLTYNEFDEVALSRESRISTQYATITSGYITPGETAEHAALREVKEELGLTLETLKNEGTYWFTKGDMLMHGFIGFTHKAPLNISEELDSAEWVPALDVPKTLYPDHPENTAYTLYRKFLQLRGLA